MNLRHYVDTTSKENRAKNSYLLNLVSNSKYRTKKANELFYSLLKKDGKEINAFRRLCIQMDELETDDIEGYISYAFNKMPVVFPGSLCSKKFLNEFVENRAFLVNCLREEIISELRAFIVSVLDDLSSSYNIAVANGLLNISNKYLRHILESCLLGKGSYHKEAILFFMSWPSAYLELDIETKLKDLRFKELLWQNWNFAKNSCNM